MHIFSKARLAGAICLLLVLGLAAHADTQLYQNGSYNHGTYGGNNPFSYNNEFVAQDFSLAGNSQLDSLVFNVFTAGDTQPVTAINVKIYNNNGGTVGSLLYSGTFAEAGDVVTDNLGYYILKDFTVNLPGWNLGAGSYYLALNVDPAQWNFHWSITNGSPMPGNDYQGDGTNWNGYSFEHDFRLYQADNATPEPGSLALLGSGLVALAGGIRRKLMA